jgi:hypothetical protein
VPGFVEEFLGYLHQPFVIQDTVQFSDCGQVPLSRVSCLLLSSIPELGVMAIRTLIQQHSFAPDDIANLVTAFNETLAALGLANREDPVTLQVAKTIIELATEGERDPIRLRDAAVKALSVTGGGEAR